MHTLALIGDGLLLASAGYGIVVLAAASLRTPPTFAAPATFPPVTVLKALCGAEPMLEARLRSFCEQDYPAPFQVIFGLREAGDPALAVAERLRRELPWVDIEIVIDPRLHGDNYKVSNLINMTAHARHDYLVLADSDVSVTPSYLRRVVPPLLDPEVGVVTCLYRARPLPNLWSRLGALFTEDWFVPAVQVASLFGSTEFAFGATIGLRRDALRAIGGFEAIANHLADDFLLGALTRRQGLRTVLSPYVVEVLGAEATFGELFRHELRWLRTIRLLRPTSYAFFCLTLSLPLGVVGLLLSRGDAYALSLFGISTMARLMLHYGQRARGQRSRLSELWLVPVRDLLSGVQWCVGFCGRSVTWRNNKFAVTADGSMRRIS